MMNLSHLNYGVLHLCLSWKRRLLTVILMGHKFLTRSRMRVMILLQRALGGCLVIYFIGPKWHKEAV
jgi:hypothetical protein